MTAGAVDVFAYDCPLCWDTGWVVFTEPAMGSDWTSGHDSVERRRRCPEGCLAPGEVPF